MTFPSNLSYVRYVVKAKHQKVKIVTESLHNGCVGEYKSYTVYTQYLKALSKCKKHHSLNKQPINK